MSLSVETVSTGNFTEVEYSTHVGPDPEGHASWRLVLHRWWALQRELRHKGSTTPRPFESERGQELLESVKAIGKG
jgi:hypothetical protein